jgi:cytochrome c peroxidase
MGSRSFRLLGAVALGGIVAAAPAGKPVETALLSAAEIESIAALGPWPAPFVADPSNRVSGEPLAIELGRRLFNDPRMSPVGYIACVSCHQTDRAFTDNKARAHGLGDLPRNTPTLANLRLQRWYGWGGASDLLWMASLRPMLDAREFDSNPAVVARIYRRDEELARCYRAVFGAAPGDDDERTMVDTAKAIAAYIETLVTGRTPFDALRDALADGDDGAAARYPAAALRGLKLFVGAAGCIGCHGGPNFSDGRFHRDARRSGDPGRHADLGVLRSAASQRLARYSDAPVTLPAPARAADLGALRTPSLRNVAVTAPYLHDGSVDALRDALAHRDVSGRLQAAQRADLHAFLLTLTDAHGARRPALRGSAADCAGG